ncbi:unnamed protein product [Rotaria socialis]|uniref:Methyltransferase FkbM domain-containing protein n=1 Tax=Rotaria socialis TaxID=392032 RepID=A0A817T8Q8_9BILA|nr:unnamed protein product [Rotaria socialis]CAF3595620.1 unnamed protein product [Rotaria socialis]CAF4612072.1 unnamed protein product [Rotaria socialis]CAF4671027.1 unnamed protein product [Rotaria socialis]
MNTLNCINPKRLVTFPLCLIISCCLSLNFYLLSVTHFKFPVTPAQTISSLAAFVNIIDPNQDIKSNITCIETKKLLDLYSTTICVHSSADFVSLRIVADRIWEEQYVTRLLRILIRNPFLDMIDIGANIGSFTMFTAGALGRFTLAVDCYLPNIERIVRAVQIQKVQNRITLVHNALYSESGKHLTLSDDLPSDIELKKPTQQNFTSQIIVQTIRFDDLLPILLEKRVQSVIIKIDIEGSENYMCETGSKMFELIDIQLVMMEWGHGFRKRYQKRYQSMIDFFTQRNYVVTDPDCTELDLKNWEILWPGNIYWIKKINFRKNIC